MGEGCYGWRGWSEGAEEAARSEGEVMMADWERRIWRLARRQGRADRESGAEGDCGNGLQLGPGEKRGKVDG